MEVVIPGEHPKWVCMQSDEGLMVRNQIASVGILMLQQFYQAMDGVQSMEKEIKQAAHRPQMENQCLCAMCQKFKQNRVSLFLTQKQLHQAKVLSQLANGTRRKSRLRWILKRLCLPTNKIVLRGPNVFISEICFYQDGQLTCFYMNKDISDPALKEIPKQRLTPTMFQKTLNERRWKYRQKIHTKKGLAGKIDTKEAILVQFKDGYEKLLSEAQFTLIMQKRRQDPFWGTVFSFKNFIHMRRQKQEGTIIKYAQGQDINQQLWQRAQTVNRVNATQITPLYDNYISQEEEEKHCEKLIESGDENRLFTYMTYKVISFVELFHDTKILKACFQWTLDQLRRPLLLDVTRLQHKELIKYDWNPEAIQRKEIENEQKVFYSKEIPPLNPESQQISLKIQSQMRTTFEDLKQYYGLSLKQQEDTEQIKNQQYFRKVYPELSVDLEKISLMDIPAFRSKYLNDKPKRKPIASQFRSSMIRVLHSMTPIKPIKNTRCYSAVKPANLSTSMRSNRPVSYKNPSTRLNSGRSTINTTWYNTFYNHNKSLNIIDF